MIATSSEAAFGPAMETAMSPESRVSVKLTTSTVRQINIARTRRRTRKRRIPADYGGRYRAGKDC
jgi:hypothetical protein